jgi:hypothetical protein
MGAVMRLVSELIKDSLDTKKLLKTNWHSGSTIDILHKYSNSPNKHYDTLNNYELILKKELEEEHKHLSTDTLDFSEKKRAHRDTYVDYINSIYPNIFPSKRAILIKSNRSYEACHFDILTDCKLRLKFDDFDTKKDIVKILESIHVQFTVFGTYLSNLTLLHHVMMSMLHGYDYDDEGDDIIIPLYAPFVKDSGKDKLLKALPTIQVKIFSLFDDIKILYESEGYYVRYRNNDIIAKHIPFYSVNSSLHYDVHEPFQIKLKNYSKILFFNLLEKSLEDKFASIDDMTPNILSINLSLNGYQPIVFTEDSLMHINIMGKKVYFVSICPELKSLYDIEAHFKTDNIDNYGISVPASYNTIIWFESDSDLSNYMCEIQLIKPDMMDILVPWEYSL